MELQLASEYSSRDAIQVLGRLYSEENRRKYPIIEEHYRIRPSYTDKTANGLTKCILHFLRFNGWQAERINCTGRPIDRRRTLTDVL
jgi:hypothetical protein